MAAPNAGTAPRPADRMEEALTTAVAEGDGVRALVTVRGTGTPTGTRAAKPADDDAGAASADAPEPGPHSASKNAVLSRVGDGVLLIRDYPNLPVLLVEITDLGALHRLTGDPQVISVRPDQPNRLDRL